MSECLSWPVGDDLQMNTSDPNRRTTAREDPWAVLNVDRSSTRSEPTLVGVISDALSSTALSSLATSLGLDIGDVGRLVQAVVPVLLERLSSNAAGGGADALTSAVRDDHDGSVLDSIVPFLGGGFKSGPGTAILGHVFGDELDGAVNDVAQRTGLPPAAVRLGFNALAPVVLGAVAKAALGVVTVVVVVKLLDVAVDSIRSGQAQRLLGRLNDRLDVDNDGNALDDVGRGAVSGTKRVAAAVSQTAGRISRNENVRAGVAKTAKVASQVATSGAKAAASTGKKLLKKLWR
jgi:Bacterial protein of unknown function (DUF937)